MGYWSVALREAIDLLGCPKKERRGGREQSGVQASDSWLPGICILQNFKSQMPSFGQSDCSWEYLHAGSWHQL